MGVGGVTGVGESTKLMPVVAPGHGGIGYVKRFPAVPGANGVCAEGSAPLSQGSGHGAPRRTWACAVLDAGGKRLLLCDARGTPVQASAALERTLAADPERGALERNMERLARSVAALRGSDGVRGLAESGERVVATVRGRYRLSATLAGASGPDPAGVLVLMEPGFREPVPDDELCARFRLTGQELRIARLIGEGLRNDEVARRTGISPHTARRHTEHVRNKMGVASRAQVGERISRS